MQKISKEDIRQKLLEHTSTHPESITLNKEDYNLLLENKSIYIIEKILYISNSININFEDCDIQNAKTALVNFTLCEDYTFSIISEIMDKLYNSMDEDADVMLCTTPIKEYPKDQINLAIYLGFD